MAAALDRDVFRSWSRSAELRSMSQKPLPQLCGQYVPRMRKHDFQAIPHFAFHNDSVSNSAFYPTIRTLSDTINVPDQNNRFSYVHNFRLIFGSFLRRPWDFWLESGQPGAGGNKVNLSRRGKIRPNLQTTINTIKPEPPSRVMSKSHAARTNFIYLDRGQSPGHELEDRLKAELELSDNWGQ
jgi:hypothetical protein